MKLKSSLPSVLLLSSLLNGALIFSARAEFSATNQLCPGIIYYSEVRTNPPQRLFVAQVDLSNPHISVRVSPGGADPDGDGQWKTTLMLPTDVAAREHFDLVVNGDFFLANHVKDAEGRLSGYRAGQWATVVGPAMTDGKTWVLAKHPRPSLIVHKNGRVTIKRLATPTADDFEVVGGNTMLVKDGVSVAPEKGGINVIRNPRTVVGLNANDTKLTLLVVDGRKRGVAAGMTSKELAREMIRLGCDRAMNLDGGGSSVMAVRDASTGQMKILNRPTDGHERAVADVLGITFKK